MKGFQLDTLKEKLISIVGPQNALFGERETKSYRTGIRVGCGEAVAVVLPKDLLQFWEIIKLCVSLEKIILIQAANTGLTGGSTPDGDKYDRDVVIINTLKLDQLLLINKGKQVLAFPGASLYKLEEILDPLDREPHSVIGSSCIGASIVGGVCNNSGGNLIKRGPAYTELSLYAQLNSDGKLELINHLGIDLGESPEEILRNLQESNFNFDNILNTEKKASDNTYKDRIRNFNSKTPARFNSDKRRLFESSGCAGKIAVFAVRLDTFLKSKNKKVFYFGSNNSSTLTDIRKTILSQFSELPDMTEYMHSSSFDGADKYGKDTFMIIKYLGKSIMPTLFRLKRIVDILFNFVPFMPQNIFDKFLQYLSNILPDHLPPRLRDYRLRFNHYLIIVASDNVIKDTRNLLNSLCFDKALSDYFECIGSEAEDILLHRYVAGLAPKRSKIMNNNVSGEVLALDVALPRNCESWYEIIPDLIFENSLESFQMAHFMCMVFHWDFVLKKGINAEKTKNEILRKLDNIGAKYPAEHNVGHLYKADEDLESFYKKLDPCNSFNAGIGQLSKNKFYVD